MTGAVTDKDLPQQIHSLTSLRFVAAAWVVLFHIKELLGPSPLNELPIFDHGYLGVDFFFILSGFILAHVYLERFTSGRFDFWSFVVKRFARIYPMHLFTLVGFIVLGIICAEADWSPSPWDPTEFLALDNGQLIRSVFVQIALIHAWGADQGLHFNMPSWSISAEWFAYLSFPVIVLMLRRSTGLKLLILSLGLVSVNVFSEAVGMRAVTTMTWNIGVFRILPEFMIGVCLYRLDRQLALSRTAALVGAFLALLGVLVLGSLARAGLLSEAALTALIVLCLALLITCSASLERFGRVPVLSNPFFVLLGEISYSVYMLHFGLSIIVLDLITDGDRFSGMMALGIAAAILALITFISYLSWRWVELPTRKWLISRLLHQNHKDG